MDLNIDDELVTKYYDLEEERKKLNNAVQERIARENYEVGKKEGKIEGKIEGIEENKKQIAIKMYKDNYDIETIAKLTELPIDKVNELIKNQD